MSVPYHLHSQILRAVALQAHIVDNQIGGAGTDLQNLLRDFVLIARDFTPLGAEYAPGARPIARGYKTQRDAYLQQAEDFLLSVDAPQRQFTQVDQGIHPQNLGGADQDLFLQAFGRLPTASLVFHNQNGAIVDIPPPDRGEQFLRFIVNTSPENILFGRDQNLADQLGRAVLFSEANLRLPSDQYIRAKGQKLTSDVTSALLYMFPAAKQLLFLLSLSTNVEGVSNFDPYKYLRPFINTVGQVAEGPNLIANRQALDEFTVFLAASGFSAATFRDFTSLGFNFGFSSYAGLLQNLTSVTVLAVAMFCYLMFVQQARIQARDNAQYTVHFRVKALSVRKRILPPAQHIAPVDPIPDNLDVDLPDYLLQNVEQEAAAAIAQPVAVPYIAPPPQLPPPGYIPPPLPEDDEEDGLVIIEPEIDDNEEDNAMAEALLAQVPVLPDDLSIRYVSMPGRGAGNGFFVLTKDTTLNDIIQLLKNAFAEVFHTNTVNSHNLFQANEDSIVVTGLEVFTRSTQFPNAHTIPNGPVVRSLVQLSLARLRAFQVPRAMNEFYGKVGVTMPFMGSNDNCILESFCYLLCWRQNMMFPGLEKSECIQHLKDTMATYTAGELQKVKDMKGYLLDTLEYLLRLEPAGAEVIVGFFSGFNHGKKRPASYPMIKLSIVDDELDVQTPADGLYFTEQEVSSVELMMIYFQGHVWPSLVQSFRVNVSSDQREEVRLYQSLKDNPPESHVLKPINLSGKVFEKMLEKNQARPRFTPQLGVRGHYGKVGGHYAAQHNQDCYSGDFETDTCASCSRLHGVDKQECFASSIAWGTTEGESVTFIGQECPLLNVGKTLETATGCVSKTLLFIRENIGAYRKFRPTMHPPSFIVNRRIYYFNGSRFDAWFLLRCALQWNIPIVPVISDQKIMSLKLWDNVEIVDFANIWSGFTLAALYKEMQLGDQVRGLNLPKAKWSCFPYMLIADSMVDPKRRYPLSELKEFGPKIWGGKCAKLPKKNEFFTGSQIVQYNLEWWESNIGPYYCAEEHLGSYCCDDTLILQYLVVTDHVLYGRGEFNGRKYDHTNAITASQAAMLYFRQTCLEEPIVSPNPKLKFMVFGEEFDMTTLLRFAYHGGKVEVFRHDSEDKRYEEAHRKYYEETGDIVREDDYDVNSMYPSEMVEAMPVKFLNADFTLNGVMQQTFVDTDIYLVDIQYEEGDCGIMATFNGFNLSPSHIPPKWHDPMLRATRLNMVFGVELNLASKRNAVIKVYGVMCFEAKVIFKTYIETLYERRLKSNTKVLKNFLKLKMNSTYGKVAQKLMGQLVTFYSAFDMEISTEFLESILVDLEFVDDGTGEHSSLFAKFIDGSKPAIGQHIPIAAYITARGRTRINNYMYYVTNLKDAAGCPIELVCIDTDSGKHRIPGINQPRTQEWLDNFMHPTELGKFKSETDGVGFDLGYFIARKTYLLHKFNAEDFKKPGEDAGEFLAKRKKLCEEDVESRGEKGKSFGEEIIMKHKGLTHGCVEPMKMAAAATQKKDEPPVRFKLPPSFQRSVKLGILRNDTMSRTMQVQNYTRTDPDEFGVTKPHADLEAFEKHLKSKLDEQKRV